jgi:hypothetical protein
MRTIAAIFQFTMVDNWTVFQYLGIPISIISSRTQIWKQILDKINKKLNQWGSQWLNLAGKVILIKVVLYALPIYQSSTLLAPKGISKKILSRFEIFFGGGKSNNKKFHLISWNQVTNSKSHGGLGIREPDLMNQALGEKLLWRTSNGKVEWWKQVLWNKYFYGSRRKSYTLRPKGTTGTSIFKLLLSASPLIMERLKWIP